MKNVLWVIAVLATVGNSTSSATQSYLLTKYDDASLAKICYALVAPFHNHFDGAVTDGAWGICGYSDRTDKAGPGTVLHNSSVFQNVGGTWKFYHKGNGYLSVKELEEINVPSGAAQRLYTAFIGDVCSRGDVPATKFYCDKQ